MLSKQYTHTTFQLTQFTLVLYIYSQQGKTEVPRVVRNSKVRKQGKFRRDWSRHASLKVGQDQVSGGVSALCWHAAPVANVLFKPHRIR